MRHATFLAVVASCVLPVHAQPPTTGLKLWLKADAGITLNGSAVTQWSDQSGNNVNASQPTAGQQPVLVASAVNGKPAVKFDGVNDYLTFTLQTNGLTGATLILVSQSDIDYNGDWNGVARAPLFFNETAGWGSLHLSPFQKIVRWRFGTTQSNNLPSYTRPAAVTGFSVSTVVKNGAVETLYVNGAQALQQSGKYPSINGVQTTGNLGRGYDNNTYFPGQIAEVLIYDHALSDADRQTVEQYLTQKYFGGGGTANTAPVVNAGPDVTVTLPASASLAGSATDDGQPGALTVSWSKVSGPGTVTFNPSNAAATSASFSAAGSYVLRLSGNDGALTSTDDVTVTVKAANVAPTVNAGPDVTVTLPASASLAGSATDDGQPGALTVSWSKVSGPGTVTFNPSNAAATSATFSSAGSYVLRLSGNDGALTSTDDVTVTVSGANTAPTVNAGPDVTVTLPASASLAGSATDDGQPGALTVSWSKVSGPGTVTFNPSNAAATSATFSAAGSYVLRLSGSDGALTSTDDVTVTVNDASSGPVPTAGLKLWLKADAGVSLNGTTVSQWADQSGNGASAAQATTDLQPTFVASAANGKPAVKFDGTNDYLTFSLPTNGLTGATLILVSQSDIDYNGDWNGVLRAPLFFNETAGWGSLHLSPFQKVVRWRFGTTQANNLPSYTRPSAVTGFSISTAIKNGAVETLYVNGAQALQQSGKYTTIAGVQATGNLGRGYDNNTYFPGQIAEVLIYDHALTDSDRQQVEQYLTQKYLSGGGPVNTAPTVNAGPDVTVTLPASASLSGSATDDGQPGGLTVGWSKVSGPGTVTFNPSNAAATAASFSAAGSYVLRLSANDGALTSTDDVTVTVNGANTAPTVNAGPDVTVTLPASASLSGSATDDGQPGALTVGWSKVSGPGTVTFNPSNAAATSASFSAAGSYVLRLSANDGAVTSIDDVSVTVKPANTAPTVNAGPDVTVTLPASASLSGSATDDGQPNSLTIGWSKVSGPGTVMFNPSNAAATSATFSAAGSYVLRLSANDGALTSTDDVTVTVNGANTAPTVNAGPDVTVTLPASASLSGSATDDGQPNSLTIGWSKVSGPGTVTFNPSNAAATSANFSVSGSYVLRLTANDGALTATDDVTVTVNDATSGPVPTTGLKLWLKADAGVSLSGSTVSQWADQSGIGANATQATTDLQPVLVNGAVNGKPALKFDGTNDYLTFTLPTNGLTGATVILVSQSDIDYNGDWNGVLRAPLFFNETAGWGSLHLSPFQKIVRWRFGTGQANNLPSYTRPSAVTGFSISTAVKDGAVETLYVNGSQALQQPGKLTTITGVNSTGNLGRGYDNNTYFPGQIAEVLIYNRALIDSERQQVEQYLNQKYLVTVPNQAPTVSAGADLTVTLPAGASLNGSATDDGQPQATPTLSWSKVSGPGTVTFGSPGAAVSSASFSAAGSYVLRLSAYDGALTSTDDTTITVNPPTNQAPVVSAGADVTVNLPGSASLTGSVTDDGLPGGGVTVGWSKVSGPGSVTFSPSNATATSASFSVAGTYVVRLTANDGALSASDDATVTVNPPDSTPPAISNIQIPSVTGTSATITWSTDESSDSQVEYGTSAGYGQSTTLNTTMTTSHSVTVSGLSPVTQYHFRVKSKDTAGNPAASGDQTFTTSASGWWDTGWHFRVPVTVGASTYARADKPVEVDLNFTQALAPLGQSFAFPESSIRVIEVDASNNVLDSAVPFQFDKDPAWDATANAKGTLIFLMKGATAANATRTYHVYFDNAAKTPATVTTLVSLTDNVTWEGQSSYQIDTASLSGGTTTRFYYQKAAGAFASMIDKQSRDWIGFHTSGGYAGDFRGIPNLIYPEGQFHPGNAQSSSVILSQGPLRLRIQSTTSDNLWQCIWDVFPDYARMTLVKKAHNYWFLYEGPPGGTMENSDYGMQSNGTSVNLLSTIWRGDLPHPDWVYFGDANLSRVLFLAAHQDNPVDDEMSSGGGLMAVFGFGRRSSSTNLTAAGTQFTIGFAETNVFANAGKVILGAYKDLVVTSGSAQSQN
jgi:hypothetical protein